MKKLCALLSLLLLTLMLSGCSSSVDTASGKNEAGTSDKVTMILDQTEYLLYQNVFFNGYGPQYEGKEVVKRGILAKVKDAFNDRDRYYVWGYLDKTQCCDWQWEFVPKDASALPPVGSLVKVTGIFRADEASLDGYWITDAATETETRYTGAQEELNMSVMSCTLERVQILNILYKSEAFQGKRFLAYGRIAGTYTLEDPYYNGSWQIPFTSSAACPAIGTMVTLQGSVSNATLSDCTLTTIQ